MGKANILSKNMCAMAEDGNSDSRPSLIAVDRAEMMRHLDELETAMNQTLQDMRSLVEESKRIPLTNTVMIDPTELMRLFGELKKVSLEQILVNRKSKQAFCGNPFVTRLSPSAFMSVCNNLLLLQKI